MFSQASGQQTFSAECGTCESCVVILAYILFCCLLASHLPVMVVIPMQLWIGLGYKNVLMQVHAQSVPHKINLLTWEIKGLKEKDSVAEWKKQRYRPLLLLKLGREWIFSQWHLCKSGHWEYALALLHPILMMQSEALEKEIEFSQIEKSS